MAKGTVKFFNTEKGFGFIKGDDGRDFFIHISNIAEEWTILNEGDLVEFVEAESDKGIHAENVVVISE